MVVCPQSGTEGVGRRRWRSAPKVAPRGSAGGDGGLPPGRYRGGRPAAMGVCPQSGTEGVGRRRWRSAPKVAPRGSAGGDGGLPPNWQQGARSRVSRVVRSALGADHHRLEEGPFAGEVSDQTAAMSALPRRWDSARVVSTRAFAIGEATSSGTLTVVPTIAMAAMIDAPS